MEATEINDETDSLNRKTYSIRCRLCRKQLLVSDKIKFSHSGGTKPCGNCVFLNEESLPDWIQDEIENSSWTKGRLKCSRVGCTARVGGFDFIQGLSCACGEYTIPAVWIQDGKVDIRVINSRDVMSSGGGENQAISETCVSRQLTGTEQSGRMNDTNRVKVISKPSQVLFCQAIGGTSMNWNMFVKQSGFNDNMNDIARPESSQQLFSQGMRETTSEIGFTQSTVTHHVNSIAMAGVKTNRLSTHLAETATAVCRQNRDKVNLTETMQQNKDQNKPVKPELGTSLNRFNALSMEEPALQKYDASPDTYVDHLTCAVCLDYFYNPYECQCSHVFCESCLRQLYHNRAGNLKCPICRSSVKYIEPANGLREEIHKLQNPGIKKREVFEKTARHRKWPLPPIGPLPFLRKRQTLVPSRDQNLVKLASLLLLVVCYIILYNLP